MGKLAHLHCRGHPAFAPGVGGGAARYRPKARGIAPPCRTINRRVDSPADSKPVGPPQTGPTYANVGPVQRAALLVRIDVMQRHARTIPSRAPHGGWTRPATSFARLNDDGARSASRHANAHGPAP